MRPVPENESLFVNNPFYLVAHYYSGTYKYNTQVTRDYFVGIADVNAESLTKFRKMESRITFDTENVTGREADYAVVSSGFALDPRESGYTKCADLKTGNIVAFSVFAKGGCGVFEKR